MTQQTKHIAVLTGDIVNSTALGEAKLEQAMSALDKQAQRLSAIYDEPMHFSRHRGDGWQIILTKPEYALRITLSFRATLRTLGKEFDSRIACATGDAELPLEENLNHETGAPFIQSGLLLQVITDDKTLRIAHAHGGAISAAFVLADFISQSWTPPQAKAINYALEKEGYHSLTYIAEQIGKSRQAVSKSLDGAGYPSLEIALTSIEESLPND